MSSPTFGHSSKVSGKTFKPERRGFDPEKHYGKTVFAKKVVARQAEQINFEQFRPLLTRIVQVIQDCRGGG